MLRAPLLLWTLALGACVTPPETDKGSSETGTTTGEGEGEGESADTCPHISLSTLSLRVEGATAGMANLSTLSITNDCDGEFPLVVTPSLKDGSSDTYSIPTDRMTIPPGVASDLDVTFTPLDFETYTATVVLGSNDPDNASIEVPVWGQAVTDADGDGFDSPAAGGEDCDDTDASVYPGATDTWYDGVDSDCEGDDDYDQDLDGYDDADYGGDDCDDTDATLHPGATDTWYDGEDTDCDGHSDYDKDGDGQDSSSYRGLDCDDTDPDIYFGADDAPYDGVDSNCDGGSDYDADGDGYESDDYGGDDCDDSDVNRNPSVSDGHDDFDSDCDGLVDEDGYSEGDVLITEVMMNPVLSNDSNGEWFELYNNASYTIDLYDWDVTASDGDAFSIDEHLSFDPGDHLLFGVSSNEAKNGGITPDYVYDRSTFSLVDTRDTIILTIVGHSITTLDYRGSWGMEAGKSLQLDKSFYNLASESSSDHWCPATSTYGEGDYGTPGSLNVGC